MRTRVLLGAALSVAAPSFSIVATSAVAQALPEGSGISLAVTVGSDPSAGACGTDNTLQVVRGDLINFCYVVTNASATTLNFHTLADDLNGPIFTDMPISLAPAQQYQYNRIVTATDSQAPVSTWTAYDVHPDYVLSTNTPDADRIFADGFEGGAADYSFIDIVATGTNLMLNDDDYTDANIGFPFTFYGQTASDLIVSNNGGMLFDSAGMRGRQGYLSPTNRVLPDRLIGPAILPYWEDLQQDYIDGIGNVFVQTLGKAPNRQFVVEWYNLPVNFGNGLSVTFEAVLFEGSNDILFQYADTACGSAVCDNGAGATIGLNFDGTRAIPYSFMQQSVGPGTAIRFHPSTPLTYTGSQQVTLDVGAPVVSVDPTSFDETVAAGHSTTDTLTIANSGNRVLTWILGSVGPVDPRAHFPVAPRFVMPMGDPAQTRNGPHPVAKGGKPNTVRAQAPLGSAVPAFAADIVNSALVSLDAAAPETTTAIGSLNGLSMLAGDFAGEDFSTLYAIDFLSFDLYKVDTATGIPTLIYLAVPPQGAGADAWNGMSWDPTTNTMFAVTSGGRTPQSSLITIDPVTAETKLVGQITGVGDPDNGTLIIDIAVNSQGLMYGVELVTDTLVAIDKTTGEASTIGSIGFDANFAAGLDFDDTTGTLYFAAFDQGTGMDGMYTLDTASGSATLVSPISSDPVSNQFAALAIARLSGICAYPDNVPWLSYSTGRGSTDPGATTPITVTFDATSLAAGTYSADICVTNNDVTNARLAVPVSLTVQ